MRRLSALSVALLLAAPSAALAAPANPVAAPTNPLSPGLPTPPVQTQTQAPAPAPVISPSSSTGSSGDSALSGGTALAIAIGALAVLAGISAFIWRDARRRAPVRQGAIATAGPGARGGRPRTKQRKLSPAERRRRKRGRAR